MKNKILYAVITALTLAAVSYVYVTPKPDPAIGEDPGMWIFEVAPILFFLHGLLSGVVLRKKKVYILSAAAVLFLLFTVLYPLAGGETSGCLLAGLAAVVLFVPCIAVGMLIAMGFLWAYRGYRKNKKV